MSIGFFNCHFGKKLVMSACAFFALMEISIAAPSDDFHLRSSDFAFEVTSTNPEYGGPVLDLLNRCFKYFSERMGVTTFGPIHFRFVLEGDAPTEVNLEMESLYYPRTVTLGDKMEFKVTVPSRDLNPVALVRTAMICQLQACMLKEAEAGLGNQLPAPPYWLTEGLTQGLLEKKTASLEKIIARIDRVGPAPTLETIQKWDGASPHRLEQWWQEACCYWLMLKATRTPSERQALCAWLQRSSAQGLTPYWDEDEKNQKWWKKVLGEKIAGKTPLHAEEETREELRRSLKLKATVKGEATPREFNLDDLPKPPVEFVSSKPFEEAMTRLLLLQRRGNLLWQEVIEGYRNAYGFWLAGKYVEYQKLIARTKSNAENVADYLAETRNYLDWYEVNHPADGPKFSALLQQSLAFQDSQELKKREQAGIDDKLTQIESGN